MPAPATPPRRPRALFLASQPYFQWRGSPIRLGFDPLSSTSPVLAADPDSDGLSNEEEANLGTDPFSSDTDGDGVSDGTEWHQGSDPLDPTDRQPHDVVEVTVHFGDDSPSHSEKYEAIITPVIGDTRPPIKLRNRNFGEPDDGLNYQANVVHAFETAPAFAAFVSDCNAVLGEMTVLAHSLGNMVVCSAIQDHGFLPDQYFMLNAAVPAEALDVSTWSAAETDNPFEFEDWVGYPSASWASRWHELFPTNDMRNQLTWKNRFTDVPQRTELYNYYSSGDEVLAVFDTPDAEISCGGMSTNFSPAASRL